MDASGLLGFLCPVRPVLGIIIQGNVPLIVLTGMVAGVLIRKMRDTGHKRIIMILVTPGFLSLAPDILYHAIWMSAVPVLIYKQSPEPLVVIVGSLIWALLMAGLTALLAKVNIRLKL